MCLWGSSFAKGLGDTPTQHNLPQCLSQSRIATEDFSLGNSLKKKKINHWTKKTPKPNNKKREEP